MPVIWVAPMPAFFSWFPPAIVCARTLPRTWRDHITTVSARPTGLGPAPRLRGTDGPVRLPLDSRAASLRAGPQQFRSPAPAFSGHGRLTRPRPPPIPTAAVRRRPRRSAVRPSSAVIWTLHCSPGSRRSASAWHSSTGSPSRATRICCVTIARLGQAARRWRPPATARAGCHTSTMARFAATIEGCAVNRALPVHIEPQLAPVGVPPSRSSNLPRQAATDDRAVEFRFGHHDLAAVIATTRLTRAPAIPPQSRFRFSRRRCLQTPRDQDDPLRVVGDLDVGPTLCHRGDTANRPPRSVAAAGRRLVGVYERSRRHHGGDARPAPQIHLSVAHDLSRHDPQEKPDPTLPESRAEPCYMLRRYSGSVERIRKRHHVSAPARESMGSTISTPAISWKSFVPSALRTA